jgi:saccharopine dehydrogenase-like NADP-dependent oxidoreductase
MKIVIIGGAGKQGSGAGALLARKPDVTEVVLVDAWEERLRDVAVRIGQKARPVVLDAGRADLVEELLGEEPKAAVMLSCIGPGFRFAEPMMRAALNAGVHFVDIQDDADAVPAVEALDEEVRAAGLTMISGIGLTPGLSNVLAKRATLELDEVEDLAIYWVANMTEQPSVANWGHRIGIWAMDVPVLEDGELTYKPGGTDEVVIEWPEPAGAVVERLCAHPEPLSLWPRLPGLRNVKVRGGYTPAEHDALLADLRVLGLTSLDPTPVAGADIVPAEFMSHFATTEEFRQTPRFQAVLEREREIGDNNGLRVEATGTKDGRRLRRTDTFFNRDRNIGIYTPAAITAYMVARGELASPGVRFPEELDPQPILDALDREGVEIRTTVEELQSA